MGKSASTGLRRNIGRNTMLAEDGIANNDKFETVFLLNSNDDFITKVDGSKHKVDLNNLTPAERKQAEGGTLTHNHPTSVKYNKTAFSKKDLETAYHLKLAEIRVAAGTFRASFKWNDKATKSDMQALSKNLSKLDSKYLKKRNKDLQKTGGKNHDKIDVKYINQTNKKLTKLAKKYNFTFTTNK